MEWVDDAIILSVQRHGERGIIVDALTRAHGRHAGLARYGASRQMRGVLQPGNEVNVRWRARLTEHLGNYSIEPVRARAAAVMFDPLRLAGLSAACALAQQVLPEREPHGPVYDAMRAMLDAVETI
ncbi:MAG TPA: DNA repair protein RecO, partial [Alphaproteobacteria bacterium]|nr:DNA repair protein RecO [Alphaproteobacteria bacterium]